MKHEDDIRELIDEIEVARIYSGALFEQYCNDGDHNKAFFFRIIRDSLREYNRALTSLVEVYK